MHHNRILPECFADTLMANMLLKSATAHTRGIFTVFEVLKRFESKKIRAIGIIDDDKRKETDLFYRQFVVKEQAPFFKLMVHPNGYHHLIVTEGRGFEVFIQQVAQQAKVEHKLLNNFGRLKRIAKSDAAEYDTDLKDLLNTLIQKRAPAFMRIKEIITPFMD